MKYLIDTNVISELTRPEPAPGVIAFFERINEDNLYLSTLTLGELHHGVAKLDDGKRKRTLHDWLSNELMQRFQGRVLSFGVEEAETWGRDRAALMRLGQPPSLMDSMIAAVAIANRCTLVTRNVRDFAMFEALEVINPFEGE